MFIVAQWSPLVVLYMCGLARHLVTTLKAEQNKFAASRLSRTLSESRRRPGIQMALD